MLWHNAKRNEKDWRAWGRTRAFTITWKQRWSTQSILARHKEHKSSRLGSGIIEATDRGFSIAKLLLTWTNIGPSRGLPSRAARSRKRKMGPSGSFNRFIWVPYMWQSTIYRIRPTQRWLKQRHDWIMVATPEVSLLCRNRDHWVQDDTPMWA